MISIENQQETNINEQSINLNESIFDFSMNQSLLLNESNITETVEIRSEKSDSDNENKSF